MAELFHAYARVATCRNSAGDIPWTAIDAYARRYQIHRFDFFEDVMFGFERIHNTIAKMRHDTETEQCPSPNTPPRRS